MNRIEILTKQAKNYADSSRSLLGDLLGGTSLFGGAR